LLARGTRSKDVNPSHKEKKVTCGRRKKTRTDGKRDTQEKRVLTLGKENERKVALQKRFPRKKKKRSLRGDTLRKDIPQLEKGGGFKKRPKLRGKFPRGGGEKRFLSWRYRSEAEFPGKEKKGGQLTLRSFP